ncbi:hypothetical protein MESS2_50034 [Mesorhizobium metallidurans STM 2683]|uniref:Uncharacterized protein n=1 Tax=Mesorhizobium metallidurans STM 2683 TaxID=1297569 RepID=M5ET77_9HYPH|nr:hypothetical protein MESS2_50034 [Mesorhizobium metallidurans STM 2683]
MKIRQARENRKDRLPGNQATVPMCADAAIGAAADRMAIPLRTKRVVPDERLSAGTARNLGSSRKGKNMPAKTGKPAA